jgi:Protein kinase domain.
VRSGTYDFKRPEWANVSESAKDLIRSILVVNPAQRLTIQQALSHP